MHAYDSPETGYLVAQAVVLFGAAYCVAHWTASAIRDYRRFRKARDLRIARAHIRASVSTRPDVPLVSVWMAVGGLGHQPQAHPELHAALAARRLGFSDLLKED